MGGGQAPSPDEAPADEPLMEDMPVEENPMDMPMEEIPMDMPMEEIPMDMPLDEMPAEEIPMDVPLEEMSAEDMPMEDEVPAAEPSDDPNHMMTPEEIAAMIESAEEAATEGSDMDEAAPAEPMADITEEAPADIAEEPSEDPLADITEEAPADIPEEPAADITAEDVIPIDFGLEGGDIPLDAEPPEPVEMPAGEEEPSTSDILGDLGLAGSEASDLDVTDIINDMPADDELNEIKEKRSKEAEKKKK